MLHDLHANFSTNTRLRKAFFYGDAAVGLLDRLQSLFPVSIGRIVRRSMTSASMPSSAIAARCVDRVSNTDTKRDKGNIIARLLDARLTDWQDEIIHLGHIKALAVHNLVFQENHRIGISNGRFQQSFGISCPDTEPRLSDREYGCTRPRSIGCAAPPPVPQRRWDRETRSARPSVRQTYRGFWPPS